MPDRKSWEPDGQGIIDFSNSEAFEQTKADMATILQKTFIHALPAVLKGFGVSTFPHKSWARLHAARLETFCEGELVDWTASIWTVVYDCGVERLLVNVDSVLAADVTGWFEDAFEIDVALVMGGPDGNAPEQQRHVERVPTLEDPDDC